MPRIVRRLGGIPFSVVADRGGGRPDPWRGYRLCLDHARDRDASHVVVIQDDAVPCFDFPCWLECRTADEPDVPLVLFLAAQPRRTALAATQARKTGSVFAPLRPGDFMPAVAVSWPKQTIDGLTSWAAGWAGRHTRSDDHMLGQWQRDTRARVLVTVPSLVQHPDDTRSLIGNGNGSAGRNPARTALFWDG